MLSIYIGTNGCEEAQLSTMEVKEFFGRNKSVITNDLQQADVVIFYACGLTERKQNGSLIAIRELQAKMRPEAKLLVWGCLPKINPQSLTGIYHGPLLGPMDTSHFEGILGKPTVTFADVSANALFTKKDLGSYAIGQQGGIWKLLDQGMDRMREFVHRNLRTVFYIRVATGCTGHCTYCSERCAWGRIHSRPMGKIVSEFEQGLRKGYSRFFLVAPDLGPFGTDTGCALPDLLERMAKTGGEKEYKIVLNQINPRDLMKLLSPMDDILSSGKIEMVGCQVQSGSNRILELMGRTYTAGQWRECMIKMHREHPNIRLRTHFMVGFPTETEEDFQATLRLLDYPIVLDEICVFAFSPRPTVYAARFPGQIPERIKELRYKRLARKHVYMHLFNLAVREKERVFQVTQTRSMGPSVHNEAGVMRS